MSEQMAVTIVDDKFDVRESLRQWLELSGYIPRTYESAEQALQDIDADYPGIVISDVMLPGIDGLGFLRRIQMIDPQLPVIHDHRLRQGQTRGRGNAVGRLRLPRKTLRP